jgi:hypothetical protein
MIEWDTGDYPAQIWGFVDLSTLPVGAMLFLRDGQALEKGVYYAIVESCDWIPEEIPGSDLFRPLMLETISLSQDGDVQERKFYLVDVETFKQPIAGVPDIGAKPKCQYLMMYPCVQWAQDFTAWIDMPPMPQMSRRWLYHLMNKSLEVKMKIASERHCRSNSKGKENKSETTAVIPVLNQCTIVVQRQSTRTPVVPVVKFTAKACKLDSCRYPTQNR